MLYRFIIGLLLSVGLLSGCSVYDAVFHPYRLGTPPISQQAKAKARAAEKARHKGTTLQASSESSDELADTGSSEPASAPAPTTSVNTDNTKSYKDLPASVRNTYDKKLLLRRSKLQRLQSSRRALHHYDLSAPKHTDATRDARRLRKHPKGSKDKNSATPKEPREATAPAPAPDPTQPAAEPASAPAQKQVKPAAPKATKTTNKKQPKAPKPDPTQPPNGTQ